MISSFIGCLAASSQNPIISLSTSVLNISSTIVESTRTGTITVTNAGTAPLIIDNLVLTGSSASEFSVSGCSSPITPGGNCALIVTFLPNTAGNKTATLTIYHNASNSPSIISLSGQGTTANGNNWVPVTSTPPGTARTGSAAYGNGTFVVLPYFNAGSSTSWYSSDGITWSATRLPISKPRAVAYGAGKFVATSGDGGAAYSVDGINWTGASIPESAYWGPITYGNGKFVTIAYGSSSNISGSRRAAYSSDGITWTVINITNTDAWWNVVYGSGKFVAVGSSYAAYSIDGITWTAITSGSPRTSQIGSLAYGNGVFVVTSALASSLWHSTDGITWTQITPNLGQLWSVITYGGGKFVGVRALNVLGVPTTRVYLSVDGVAWTIEPTSLPTNSSTTAEYIAYGGGKYVCTRYTAGSTGVIAYST